MREYYYRPPELTGEKILETFLAFQDERDIPVTQEGINNFFLNTFIDVCSSLIPEEVSNDYPVYRVKELKPISLPPTLLSPVKENSIRKDISSYIDKQPNLLYPKDVCYDEVYAEVLDFLLEDVERPDIILDVLVMPNAGNAVTLEDGTVLLMPRIYLRVIE